MKTIRKPLGRDKRGKMATVTALFAGAVLITCSGAWFGVYSVVSNVSFRVMNTSIPGFVLALLVVYFGVRSFLSVNKLSKVILKDSSYFSWSNFKRAKPAKSR
jgi:FtsH-binding integral membrane protein